ncbi:MAG: bestrophin family ion channel [Synechococcales bacterium]|nr:bestrophin family ion channel [Synechococcales bacterium]
MLERLSWFRLALQLKGSVLPSVLPRSLICGLMGILVAILHGQGVPVVLPTRESLIPSIVLGLLLVFRTNTAYDRFWEGRKCWGTLIINTRNLARQLWIAIQEQNPPDRQEKIAALQLLEAFAWATKQHLRQEPMGEQVTRLVSQHQNLQLQETSNRPLEIAFWLGDYLQQQYQKQRIDSYQMTAMTQLLDRLVEALSGCERILRTPMPLAYAIHLKQLLLIYCLALPFQLVKDCGWFTVPLVIVVSFTLLGIEEIGIEIENPFGRDANDLPLDAICETISRNIHDLMQLESSTALPSVDQLKDLQQIPE